MLDRDFVLTLESEAAQSSSILTPDREGHVALASLRIPPQPLAEAEPLVLKVVIDCSGSMGGTSIVQARKAALEILNLLRPEDVFNVTLFGSNYTHLFRTLVPASARYITEAWNRLDQLDASMGGTEMEKALDAVFSMSGSDAPATILLITDGEIHQHEKLVKRAAKSGHRIFAVGVGTSVAEVFLKSLSSVTQGACELVAPQEGMAERVLGQFHRMRQPRLGELRIDWPVKPDWMTALPEVVFGGDTVHVFAGFAKPAEGNVRLQVQGSPDVVAAIIGASEAEIPRIAAARRMDTATDEQSLRLALDYQLLSRWTNFLVIAERADKAEDLPELHQVPQMLAAGWGGTAGTAPMFSRRSSSIPTLRSNAAYSVASALVDFDSSVKSCDFSMSNLSDSEARVSPKARSRIMRSEKLQPVGSMLDSSVRQGSPVAFIQAMERDLSARTPMLPGTITALEYWGLDFSVVVSLRQRVKEGHAESEVVAAFIYALTQSVIGDQFGRSIKRAVLKGWKHVLPGQALDDDMKAALKDVTVDAWNWLPVDHDVAVLP
jgi:Ca-activated chloride channel family protein